jgi:hypothetical protein
MAQRPVLVFLAKVVPLIVLLLVLWQGLGLSRPYHRLLAGVVGKVYPHIDPTGTVKDVGVRGDQFYFRLAVGGERIGLSVNAADITSNMTMLLALFLASPIRRRIRQFLVFFACALVLTFVCHAVTLVTVSQEALMTHPGVMASAPFSTAQMKLIPRYNVFAEELGMYLGVLVLWLPYIAWCILRVRDDSHPGESEILPA